MESPAYIGHIDAIQNDEIHGWALNTACKTEPVIVTISIDGEPIAEALAGYYRPDVAKALQCSGSQGFYFDLESLCDGPSKVNIDVHFPDGSAITGGPIAYQPSAKHSGPRRPTVLFMHLPKTAGTSFREIVVRNYKQSQVAYIYGDPPGLTTMLGDIPLAQRARLRLLFGHYGYGAHFQIPNECRYVALVRPPGLRVWSHYTHIVRDKHPITLDSGRVKTIEQVLEERQAPYLDNLYVRFFCGYPDSECAPGAVNRDLYEKALAQAREPNVYLKLHQDLDQAYASLADDMGWIPGLTCPRVNTSPAPHILPTVREQQIIQEFNSWDFRLYKELAEGANQRVASHVP